MTTLLLIIIYFAFISLGLPDAILGSAWPIMRTELGLPISGAGLISMIISGGTIVSSILSGRLIRRFGTGKLTLISVLLTAVALMGFAISGNYIGLCIMAIPLGLGAGAVDAALNHFVALHYSARHMNWLHCFWGVGATAGPVIMSFMINKTNVWENGYKAVSIIQFFLVIFLFISLPLWKKFKNGQKTSNEKSKAKRNVLSISGVKIALLGFFGYCAVEATTGLWGASYLVQIKGISKEIAAGWISTFYLGITLGRFINGFLTIGLNSKTLIRIGQSLILSGVIMLFFVSGWGNLIAILFIGLGCAPIYPSMLHETPNRFGKENSSALMGIQMASAYIGTTFVPPIVGLVSDKISLKIYPLALLILTIVMVISSEIINKKGSYIEESI
ncbi:MFS transporter [Tissierella sp. Yu-01]|uniref:MFS transporter n=1 Tax=Tissierella sp. Yu-01 TaxID=3035694 RepID=UPI00240DD5DC|nr:MFS transporter [Tissierella sp. Yu-01]WFA07767.1 MFS transporter [Tissierella sp. Yu-01]